MLADSLELLIDIKVLENQDAEDRYITDGVSWQQYEALLTRRGDRPGYRIVYLDGVLEIVAPSRRHESRKTRIGTLLEIYFLETETDYFPLGSTTFRMQEQRGGAEPDESYCIGAEREIPDLAIEVVLTSGGINRLEVYHRLGVREVWFWQGDRFALYHPREATPSQFVHTYGYEAMTRSALLPELDIELLAACVRYANPLAAIKEFRARLREPGGHDNR
jgi:Uma2 family endonuclease